MKLELSPASYLLLLHFRFFLIPRGATPGSGVWALSPVATTRGARETREISSTDALPHTGLLLKP